MEYLIVYTSKTGTTKKCAEILKEKLENSTLINLEEKNPNLEKYSTIIIGTPIRMGKIDSKIKKFIKNNEKILLTKKVGYFVCCYFENEYDNYFKANFKEELLKHSIIYSSFGGLIDLNKLKGFSKIIANMVVKTNKKNTKINEENINKFLEKIK